jgi:response regulator RpfG family c-di-GMP phosphodiesterase
LREDTSTASIPVLFMTARAQAREVDHFRSLGAVGVIPKPFDPMTLAASVRSYVRPAADPIDDLRAGFLQRVKKDAAALSKDRCMLADGHRVHSTLERIKRTAHGLSGAGGIYGFAEISETAADLEDAVIAELADPDRGEATDRALDGLIFCTGNCDSAGRRLVQIPQQA